jgi:hypothetical protein
MHCATRAAVQDRFQRFHASLLQLVSDTAPINVHSQRLRDPVVKILATYMPYYRPPSDVVIGLLSLPHLSSASHNQRNVPDFMMKEFSKKLGLIPSVKSLVRYLDGLEGVAQLLGPSDLISEVPKAQLQNQLYFLSLPGGPRCALNCSSCVLWPWRSPEVCLGSNGEPHVANVGHGCACYSPA